MLQQPQEIRVLIVDDHAMVRQGLRAVLDAERDMQVVAEAQDGQEALRLVTEHQPDVVVMDIHLPGMSGIEATRRLVADGVSTRVLALSVHDDREFIIEMLRAGARGYLLKQSAAHELADAIRTVSRQESALAPQAARALVDQVVGRRPPVHPDDELTQREREVLRLIAIGKTSREIGEELQLRTKTVDNYRAQILKKLQASNKVEAVGKAIQRGLLRVTDLAQPTAA